MTVKSKKYLYAEWDTKNYRKELFTHEKQMLYMNKGDSKLSLIVPIMWMYG